MSPVAFPGVIGIMAVPMPPTASANLCSARGHSSGSTAAW